MKSFLCFLLLCSLFASPVLAQIGMGGPPHSSAALDVKSTNKAFYPPRLTSSQRKAIVGPQVGAFVFDTDKRTFYLFDGEGWSPLAFTFATSFPTTDRVASDGLTGDSFGISVSISGDYALVGAHQDDVAATDQGSAYIFVRSGGSWTQQAKLIASDGAAGDLFGSSVSLSGNYALVGAVQADVGAATNRGAAYMFVRSGPTTWTQQAKIVALDGTAGDAFGGSVSLSGDYALVGAAQDEAGRGSVYGFLRNVDFWNQQFKFIPSDGAAGDNFGTSVAISGNYAVMGAYNDDIGTNTNQGSAYVFFRNGIIWTQQAKLTANDGQANDNFGNSVAISGDYALVGAYGDNSNKGAAYIYSRNGTDWSQQAKLTASDALDGDRFGSSVAISGDYALVGAALDDVGADTDQGSVHLYHLSGNTWTLVKQITDNSAANTRYGNGVGISNGSFIIGGPGSDTNKGKVAFGTVDN